MLFSLFLKYQLSKLSSILFTLKFKQVMRETFLQLTGGMKTMFDIFLAFHCLSPGVKLTLFLHICMYDTLFKTQNLDLFTDIIYTFCECFHRHSSVLCFCISVVLTALIRPCESMLLQTASSKPDLVKAASVYLKINPSFAGLFSKCI